MSESSEQKDAFCTELIASTKSREVLAWLREQNSNNTLGKLKTSQASLQLIEEVMNAGAIKVMAVEIDTYDIRMENTGKLCIELPLEPDIRNRIFKWTGRIANSQGYDQERDVGQRYIFVMLD